MHTRPMSFARLARRLALCWLLPAAALADTPIDFDDCLATRLRAAGDEVTVGALRRACREELTSASADEMGAAPAVTRRLVAEGETMGRPFVITPHRPNYLLLAYNVSEPNLGAFAGQFPSLGEDPFKPVETKFQISLKFPLAHDLLGSGGDLFFAYTNRSFWQQFQTDDVVSSPFRETDHEAEAWLSFVNDWKFLGFTNRVNHVGLSHQSNGRAGALSRSWNRVYATLVLERGDLALALKPWWRLPEDAATDDNPDIEAYLGNFEVYGVYKAGRHTFAAMGRHNLELGSPRGALQLDWSFPLRGQLRGYVQLFNGFGESLIDYDHSVTSLGFGVQFSDWL